MYVIGEFTSATEPFYTGLSVVIPAKSCYSLYTAAVWKGGKPEEIYVSPSISTYNRLPYTTGTNAYLSASTSWAGYAEEDITFYVWVKYDNASINNAFIGGFYVTM